MANNRARYEEALRRGHSYSWDQRWPEAVGEFQTAIKEDANEPAPYAGLGMAFFELGELERALESYKLAARLSQGDMIYLKHVADVQERLGQLSQAGQTYMAIGEIQLRRRKLDEAVGNWLRAVRLEPNLVGGHQRLATVYQRQGLTRNAIREYLAIARIFHMRGEKAKALRTCQLALNLDPRNADIMTAMELIEHGEDFLLEEEEQLKPGSEAMAETVTDAVQRMASVFEAERTTWQLETGVEESSNPVQAAQRKAFEQLATEIFEEEEEDEPFGAPREGLSKLEKDALISQALDFQTRGVFDKAISCYERAIDGGLTSSAAHFCLGVLYQNQLRLEEAIRQFEICVNDQEYSLASHCALGESYQGRGNVRRAVEHFVAALKIIDLSTARKEQADRLAELYKPFADSLLAEGETEKAKNFVNAMIEFLDQDDWEGKIAASRMKLDTISSDGRPIILADMLIAGSALVLESLYLSQEYAKRGNYDTAVEEAFWAIQLAPDYLPGHLQLAELMAKQDRTNIAVTKLVTIANTYSTRNDINGAISTYERALELEPMNLAARMRLIELLRQHGHVDRALEHYMAMGAAHYSLAQVNKAWETYVAAIDLAPRGSVERKWRSRLLRLIADIDMQRLDWKRALDAYNELSASDPDDEHVALTLVDLYYKVGRPEGALRQLDRYLIRLVRSGQGARIGRILKELIEVRPTDAGLVDRLTRLYLQQKRSQDAIQLLDKLSEAQLDAGQTKQAIGTIERILKLNPPNAASYRQLLQRLHQDAS